MPRLTDIPETWSDPIEATTFELWQCQAGTVQIAWGDTAPGEGEGGIELRPGDAVEVSPGETVRYRRLPGAPASVIERQIRA